METFYFVGDKSTNKEIVAKMLSSRKNLKFYNLNKMEKVEQGSIVVVDSSLINDIDNRHLIKTTGRVVYLKTDNFKDELVCNFYEELANFIIEADKKSLKSIFEETLAVYNNANKVKCHIYIK